MKKFYPTVVEYFQRKLPINSELLQDMKCLHPLLQKDEKGVSCIRRIAPKMPQVISSGEIASVTIYGETGYKRRLTVKVK